MRHTQYWIQNRNLKFCENFRVVIRQNLTDVMNLSCRFIRENVGQWNCGPVVGRAGPSQCRKRPDMQRAVYIWTLSFFFHGASVKSTETQWHVLLGTGSPRLRLPRLSHSSWALGNVKLVAALNWLARKCMESALTSLWPRYFGPALRKRQMTNNVRKQI